MGSLTLRDLFGQAEGNDTIGKMKVVSVLESLLAWARSARRAWRRSASPTRAGSRAWASSSARRCSRPSPAEQARARPGVARDGLRPAGVGHHDDGRTPRRPARHRARPGRRSVSGHGRRAGHVAPRVRPLRGAAPRGGRRARLAPGRPRPAGRRDHRVAPRGVDRPQRGPDGGHVLRDLRTRGAGPAGGRARGHEPRAGPGENAERERVGASATCALRHRRRRPSVFDLVLDSGELSPESWPSASPRWRALSAERPAGGDFTGAARA